MSTPSSSSSIAPNTYDVLVVGAGVIGLSIAYELAKEGQRVAVLEKKHMGFGASGASAALLEFQIDAFRGDPFFSLAKASNALFPQLRDEILDLTAVDIRYEQCGILQLAFSQEDRDALIAEAKRQSTLGLRAQWINRPDCVSPRALGGVFFEEDGQVVGEHFLRGLMRAAQEKGVRLLEDLHALKLVVDQERVTGLTNGISHWNAARVVVAAGAWSDEVLEPLGVRLGLDPIKGELLVFDTPHRPTPFPLYTRQRGYIAPKDGTTLVGATVERVGFDTTPTQAAQHLLWRKGVDLLPDLEFKRFRSITIAGLRPGTPDEIPFIGPLQMHPNVIMATGHFRNGVLLAPITAKLVTELITQKSPSLPLSPFAPERFHQTK